MYVGDRFGVSLGFAYGQVTAEPVDPGASQCELGVQLGGLDLLGLLLGVERPALHFGPAVVAVNPPIPPFVKQALPRAIGRVDMNSDGERAVRGHEVEQPAEPRLLGERADVARLLHVLCRSA